MRLGAYVIAGDPAWAEDSLRSYYDLVDYVVVAYDASGRSWSGAPLSVAESLDRLRSVDTEGKIVELAGDFSDPSRSRLVLDTEQRQAALDRVGTDVDWVIQLDTDEILLDPAKFVETLEHADAAGASGLDYPARYVYQRTDDGRFLEVSTRWWRSAAGYPGPVAVRAGTRLVHCRQASVPLYRADFRAWTTDAPGNTTQRVDEIVRPQSAIAHMSWVRTEAQIEEKSVVSGHPDRYPPRVIESWRRSARRPWQAVAKTPLRSKGLGRLRLTRLPIALQGNDWLQD